MTTGIAGAVGVRRTETCLVEPGRFFGFKLAPMTAWLFFSGLVIFAYLFFVQWRIVTWAQIAEFAPLYGLLLAGGWFSRNSRGVESLAVHHARAIYL